jgi:hypothetical protein
LPYQTLAEFRGEPATAVVSLGRSCTAAYNLRRHYDFGGAFPFDWWVTPVAGVRGLLRRPDPDWLYDPALIEIVENGATVRHRELGILLHHEFPRRWGEPGIPVRSDFREKIARPKERTAFLLSKLLKLNQTIEHILFVRERVLGDKDSPADALSEVFDRASWTLVEWDQLARPNRDWRGDPDEWDALLSGLGVSYLRRLDEKPFSPIEPGATAHER